MAESKQTTDHETIRRWVEERGGRPARVKDTGNGDEPGIVRIDHPGRGDDDALEEISWDDFFPRVRGEPARVPLPGGDGGRRGEPLLEARQSLRR